MEIRVAAKREAPMPARLAEYVQHKPNCAALCADCGRSKASIYHREHWRPGCGVFWHDFTSKGDCTCGLADALRSGETPRPSVRSTTQPSDTSASAAHRSVEQLREWAEWSRHSGSAHMSAATAELVLALLAVDPRADQSGEAGDRRSDRLRQIQDLPLADRLQVGIQATEEIAARLTKFADEKP